MELDIDQGNSRLKWRFSRQSMQYGSTASLLQEVRAAKINQVRMVSVVENTRQQQLINLIVVASSLPIDWSIANSTSECMGVTNGYKKPEQLGADRWCAIVAAALELQPPKKGMVLLGCGTAYTVDFIDAEKHHLGGWIAPSMMALEQGLQQCVNMTFDISNANTPAPLGDSTNDCVSLGCNAMIKGLIEQLQHRATICFPYGWMLVVYGGDAERITVQLPQEVSHLLASELVLDGLAYVCNKQQQHSSYSSI